MNFRDIFLVSSFLVIAMTGCEVHSIAAAGKVPLPPAWKNAGHFPVAAPSRDLTRWWVKFDDPTLTQLIAQALSQSPTVESASARIRESQARRNAENASLFPALRGSASAASNLSSNDGAGSASSSTFGSGLNASWEADLFGKHRSLIEAASAQIGAAEENFHSVQAALAAEIAIAYTRVRVNEAALNVLRQTIQTREETSRLATWRTQAGLADSLESSQALSSLEQARAAVPAFEQNASQSRNRLTLLAGQAPGSLDPLLFASKKSIPNPAHSLALAIPADTLRQRPDVRLAGYQLLAAAAQSRAVDAERFPTLNLTGSLGLNSLSATRIFTPETVSSGIIAGLTGPIFDAGRIRANIDAQNASEQQAFQTYRSTVLTALAEVEDSLIACRRTSERLEILERAALAAREAAQLAQQRYQAGVTDILTVLDSQRTLLGLEDSLFTVRANRSIAYIQLYKALGGGWS